MNSHAATDLLHFLTDVMKMQGEVYQPWIVCYLLHHGGRAKLNDLADEYSRRLDDSSKRLPARDRLRQAVKRVLERHGVAKLVNGEVVLTCRRLSESDQKEILVVCARKIREVRH